MSSRTQFANDHTRNDMEVCDPATLAEYNEIFTNLVFISKVPIGQKINTCSMTYTDSSSWLGAFKRTVSGEGRAKLLSYTGRTISRAIDLLSRKITKNAKKSIAISLNGAQMGINNLLVTYETDPGVCASLSVQIASIRSCLDNPYIKELIYNETSHEPSHEQPSNKDFSSAETTSLEST